MIPKNVVDKTKARYAGREKGQAQIQEVIQSGQVTPLTLDTPERVEKYLRRRGLTEIAAVVPSVIGQLPVQPPKPPSTIADTARMPQPERLLYERVLGTSQLMAVRFLERGARLARAVGRIRLRDQSGETVGYGTGTLVSPRLLLTNNHVLPDKGNAQHSWVEFGYHEGAPGKLLPPIPFELDPDAFFETSDGLDYTVVAVRGSGVDSTPLVKFGFARLREEEGKVLVGQTLNIIQHPNGEPKQVALRENDLLELLDDFLHYHTDTAPGSSGSLVCSDEWEVVALHHSGVPEEHPNGGYMAMDGSVWMSSMGEHRLKWRANEGVRISRILKDLKGRVLAPAARALVNEIFSPPPSEPSDGGERTIQPPPFGGSGTPSSAGATIQITIALPGSSPCRETPAVSIVGPDRPSTTALSSGVAGRVPAELDQALADLAEAKKLPYYSVTQDEADTKAYYENLDLTLGQVALFGALHDLLEDTHATRLRYAPAKHVYTWVDLQPNLQLRSIYSGLEFEPEQIIREDFRILRERVRRAEETLRTREGVFTEAQLLREVDLLEAAMPYNCEHVVPQSWFGKKEPMRGDLHHLFTCESGCNSFRSNTPYFDFTDFEEAVRDECGKREANKFEPGAGKGAVARATLYFLIRYPGEINDNAAEYTPNRVAILLGWHDANPVSKWERHRNAVIFRKQGNRNPLIDHPEWAARLDFGDGLG